MKNINVKIKLLEGGKIPEYKTDGAACADCYVNLAADEINIPPMSSALIGLGFALEIPEGYEVVIEPRSSFAHKHKGVVIHGEIDSDYRGQLMANTFNLNPTTPLNIKNGDRICQIKILPVLHMKFEEVNELSETKRGEGGFGSTGRS